MGRSDLVSVIVPAYNVEKYLNACVESVINQSYQNWELILVDDGSKDRTAEICDKWGQKDNRIRVIHQDNAGVGAARNAGLDMVKGDYIAFLDSDDCYTPDALEYLLQRINDTGVDLVIGSICHHDENMFSAINEEVHEEVLDEKGCWLKNNVYSEQLVCSTVKIYPKKFFEDIRFPEGEINEDTSILISLFSKCNKILFSDKRIINYRIRIGSITHTPFDRRNLHLGDVYYEIIEYLCDKGYHDAIPSFFRDATDYLIKARCRLDKSDTQSWEMLDNMVLKYRDLFERIEKCGVNDSLAQKCKLYRISPKIFFSTKRLVYIAKGITIGKY